MARLGAPARWQLVAAAERLASPDGAGRLELAGHTCIFGTEAHTRALVDSLPPESTTYRRLVRFDGRGFPELLVLSELFGHRTGAFPGAVRDKTGLVWTTAGAALIVERFDLLPRSVQRAVIRFAETAEVRPLGSRAPVCRVDTKIVLTTRNPTSVVQGAAVSVRPGEQLERQTTETRGFRPTSNRRTTA